MASGVSVLSVTDVQLEQITRSTANLNSAAGTYDLCTANGGGVLIRNVAVYVNTAGATFTSVSIQTNQTNATTIMSAAEGAVANLTAQRNVPIANHSLPTYLAGGQKLQFTITGSTGTGQLLVVINYKSVDANARLN